MALLCIFVVQKPIFMLVYLQNYQGTFSDWGNVILHGLPLDLSLSGYLTVVPLILMIVSLFISGDSIKKAMNIYFGIISVTLSLVFVSDLALYGYWGFRLDSTPLFYLLSSPADAMASVSEVEVAVGVLVILLTAMLIFGCLYFTIGRSLLHHLPAVNNTALHVGILLVFGALLFIPIRGGFTVSTMNTGKAYFSTDMKLNHAAVNPLFSFMESLSRQSDFSSQYRFLNPTEADNIFAAMKNVADAPSETLLTTDRPNMMIVILEGFSAYLMPTLGGENIAVGLDSIAREGVLFTNFYADSFRTDRGLVSILSGYPSQPSTSLMKYPRKTQHLPSICKSLVAVGYTGEYFYGGDADFTNMRSYLMASGFSKIVADTDFPMEERMSKWGVHDHLLLRRVLDEVKEDKTESRKFRVVQTSSSHEPFEVPFRRLSDNRANAFAYTDSCVTDFINQLRRMPQWDNTLMILVPDHQGGYPQGVNNLSPERYHIPLVLTGGAVSKSMQVDVFGSQHDIAATLLAQLGLPADQFLFSKDLFNLQTLHFAYFSFPDAFGMIAEGGVAVYDCKSGKIVSKEGCAGDTLLHRGKAYLQKIYDNLDEL